MDVKHKMMWFLIGFLNAQVLNQSARCQTCILIYQYAQFLYSQEISGEDLKASLSSMCQQSLSNFPKDICDDLIQHNILTLYDQVIHKFSPSFYCNQTSYCALSEFNKPPASFKDKVSHVWGRRDVYVEKVTK